MKDKPGKHKLNNGSTYTVKGFTPSGDMVLANGWTIAKECGHVAHGYVSTSHASQGKTVDRVFIAMGGESLRAINAEQFYVSVSRGREKAAIYSDLPSDRLRTAIQRSDGRKTATELMGRDESLVKATHKEKLREFMQRVAGAYRQLRERSSVLLQRNKERELSHER